MAKTAKNKNFHSAKDNKQDEFYTQLSDIERELINNTSKTRLFIVIVMTHELAISFIIFLTILKSLVLKN